MAATTAASFWAQNEQAQGVEDAANAEAEQRSSLIKDQTAQTNRERSEDGRRERARLMALAGEAGISGASVDAQQQVSHANQSRAQGINRTNANNQMKGVAAGAASTIAQNPKPNMLATGLSLGGTFAGDPKVQSAVKKRWNGGGTSPDPIPRAPR